MKIICLEGIICAGKSTQVSRLCGALSPAVCIIPELNNFSPLKAVIAQWRKKALEKGKVQFTKPEIEELAIARAKTQHNFLASLPELPYILTDRSVYTSIVYEAGEVKPEEIQYINKQAGVVFPDFGFILDCDPNEALRRADKRRKLQNLCLGPSIHENLDEITKRRELYLNLLKTRPELILIDANQSEEEVFNQLISYFLEGKI